MKKMADVSVVLKNNVAIVLLKEDISDTSMVDCIAKIDELVDEYYYDKVELRILSPGGQVSSMNYFLNHMEEWERKNVSLNTRALATSASAAAVILSLGHERRAQPGANLLYHNARQVLNTAQAITALEAKRLAADLGRPDKRIVDLLAKRARKVVREDWIKYLKNGDSSFSIKDTNAEHEFCAALFNLPVERHWVFHVYHYSADFAHRLETGHFALPLYEDKDLARNEVFSRDEIWKYISGTRDTEASSLNNETDTDDAAISLFKEIFRKTHFHSWELTEDFDVKEDVDKLPEGVDVEVTRSPEFRIKEVMGELLELVGDDDDLLEKRLCALYENLFRLDQRIVPEAAMALGLIDGIGYEGVAFGYRPAASRRPNGQVSKRNVCGSGKNVLSVPEWGPVYFEGVPWNDLCRHMLILGETGAGKTKSGIMPLVKGILDAASDGPGRVGCMLVIDPKKEISTYLEQWAMARDKVNIHKLDVGGKEGHRPIRLDLMKFEQQPLGFTEGYYVERAKAMFRIVGSLIPGHAASILLHKSGGRQTDFWDQQGLELVVIYVAIAMILEKCVALGLTPDGPADWNLREIFDNREVNILYKTKQLYQNFDDGKGLERLLGLVKEIQKAFAGNGIFDELSEKTVGGVVKDMGPLLARLSGGEGGGYANSVFACAANFFFQITDDRLAKSLFFGVERGRECRNMLDFVDEVSINKRDLDIFVYQPELTRSEGEIIGRAVKASYFSAILSSAERASSDEMPYVGYVADEFHRFITDDIRHGEQSFLDTCRSFGGFCALACQSVASMRHALMGFGGERIDSALDVVLNNTATKFFFRATDSATMARLEPLCREGTWGKVSRWRPVSMLSPGECYACTADGRLERRQLRQIGDDG